MGFPLHLLDPVANRSIGPEQPSGQKDGIGLTDIGGVALGFSFEMRVRRVAQGLITRDPVLDGPEYGRAQLLEISFETLLLDVLDLFTVHRGMVHNGKEAAALPVILTKENLNSMLSAEYIIAVGTTALRTLESAYWFGVQLLLSAKTAFHIDKLTPYKYQIEELPSLNKSINKILDYMHSNNLESIKGDTEIFIMPGYDFKACQGLITNFHQPGSTLILLVAAFIGDDWREIYNSALRSDYRFLSYGDSTLLLK